MHEDAEDIINQMNTLYQGIVDQSDALTDDRIINLERFTTDDVARVRTNLTFQLNHVLISPQAFYSEPNVEHALRDSINAIAEATATATTSRGVGINLRDIDITGENSVRSRNDMMEVEDVEEEEKEEEEEEQHQEQEQEPSGGEEIMDTEERKQEEEEKEEEKKDEQDVSARAIADRVNIRRGELPMNEFLENDKLFLGAFPMLFFLGEGWKGSASANPVFIRHLMRQHDNRFARCLPLMFGLFNQNQRHLVCREVKAR